MKKSLILLLSILTINGQVLLDHYTGTSGGSGNGLLNDLAVYLRFEESMADLPALDATANGRHFSVSGELESQSGAILNSRFHDTNADDDYFYRADEDWQHFGNTNFTIAFWYQNETPTGEVGDQTLLVKGDSGFSWLINLDRGIGYTNEYAFQFYYTEDGGAPINMFSLQLTEPRSGEQYFIYVRRDGNNFDMGYALESETTITKIATTTANVTFYDSADPLTVGVWLNGGAVVTSGDLEGWVDEVGIWNTNLSNCQLMKLKNKTTFANFDNLSCL